MDRKFESHLQIALQENFNHARHQETQRERYMAWYWTLWAAAFAYVGRQGTFCEQVAPNAPIFTFLAVMSFVALVATLKWNTEYANHIAAIAAIAQKLGLNTPTPGQKKIEKTVLPYPEFVGYLALPLNFPLLLNVGVVLSLVHCMAAGLSVALASYGFTLCRSMAIVIGGTAAVVALFICHFFKGRMEIGVPARMPQDLPDTVETSQNGDPPSGNRV